MVERWCIKNANGYYWGVGEGIRCWGSRNDAKIYRSRFHAHVDMADWPESAFDREQPRIVRLVPKAPVRDESAIRADERARIAGLFKQTGSLVQFNGCVVAETTGLTAMVLGAARIAEMVKACHWPAGTEGKK